MKKVLIMLVLMATATVCTAETGRMIVEPGGSQRVQIFAPDWTYDAIITPVVTPISVSGFLAINMNSTVDCKLWKSGTNSRSGRVAIPVIGGGDSIKGVNATVKFFIYSGCSGVMEKQ